MDENREIRAMLFSCLHLPPLPTVALQVERDEDRVTGDGVTSSHTLIGYMIEWVGLAKNHTLNTQRMLEQYAMLSQFRQELAGLDLGACTDESLYELYCHHTRLWLGCYTKAGKGTCFKPLDYVATGDRIHANMIDYCKAQFHHFTEGKETLTLEPSTTYRCMLRKCARWTQQAYSKDESASVEEVD